MRRNHLDPYDSKSQVEGITIVGRIPDQALGALGGKGRSKSGWDKGNFMWRSRRRVDGDRKTSAVCHRHELRTLAPFALSHTQAPFFAMKKVPSRKHALRASSPRSWR
jgi:hypothetical protein